MEHSPEALPETATLSEAAAEELCALTAATATKRRVAILLAETNIVTD